MKKIIMIVLIIMIIVIGTICGGYFVFKDEIDSLKVELGDNFSKGIKGILKVQFDDRKNAQVGDNTYIVNSRNAIEAINDFVTNEYNVVKMQELAGLILYEAEDKSRVVTVNYEDSSIYTIFTVEEKVGKGTDFEILFSNKKNAGTKKIIDSNKSEEYDYNIYSYNGNIDIKVKMRQKNLKDALNDGDITMERIIQKAEQDASEGKITATPYDDGGSTIYQYGTYTILKCNTLDGNHDVYIGSFGMKFEDVIEG